MANAKQGGSHGDEEEQAELREYASSEEADETDYEDDDDDDDGGGKDKRPHYTEEDHVRLMRCVTEFLIGENTVGRGQGKGPMMRLYNRMEAFLVAVLALKQLHDLDNLCDQGEARCGEPVAAWQASVQGNHCSPAAHLQ